MGYYKELQIQQEEDEIRGYSLPTEGEKFLCPDHYSDKYISNFICKHGHNGRCSYCGKNTTVIDLRDFIEYLGNKIQEWFEDIDDACLPLERSFYDDDDEEISGFVRRNGYIAPGDATFYVSTEEAMEDLGLIAHGCGSEILNNDVSLFLYISNRIRKNPTMLLLSDELSLKWKQFCDLVKYKQRYTFFKSDIFSNNVIYHSDNGLFDILSELRSLVHSIETKVVKGTSIYRCRVCDKKDIISCFDDMTSPPSKFAKSNRFNPAGISMFYGAFDEQTAIKEVQNYTTQNDLIILYGTFELKKDISVIDLFNMPVISFWMDNWQEISFLYQFHNEISKPIAHNDSVVEYVPTQIFTEYLRYLCLDNDNKHYDGIVYKSSITNKRNIVLFYGQKDSADILELKKISTIKE